MLWQRKGIPIEGFLEWPRKKKIVYIASELLEMESPVNSANQLIKALSKVKGGKH